MSALGALRVSTDIAELDVDLIHDFLTHQSNWARGIARGTVATSLQHSLCFGGYVDDQRGTRQVAFARVISDYATFANLVDVFVLPAWRGFGYSKDLLRAIDAHPRMQNLRRFTLATADAHGLYAQFGFTAPLKPQTLMERHVPDLHARAAPGPAPL